jgi:fatty acid desaturase
MSTTRQRVTGDAILAEGGDGGIDWSRIFRIFMRALAVLTIGRGLGQWAVICGMTDADGIGFEDYSPALQASTIFFAVIELVAGVGLWLTAAWGGVVWVLATAVALSIDAAALYGLQGWVQMAARPLAATAGDIALLAFLLLVTVAAARQADALGE